MTALWLFPSPLVPRLGGWGGRRYACVGKECWKCAGTVKVGSLCAGRGPVWYLLPLMVFVAHGGRSSSRWIRRRSECTFEMHFSLPFFIFSCTTWMTLSLSQHLRASFERQWLRVGRSGREPRNKRSPKVLVRIPSTLRISHLTPAVSKRSNDMINKTRVGPALLGPTGVWNIVSFVLYFVSYIFLFPTKHLTATSDWG